MLSEADYIRIEKQANKLYSELEKNVMQQIEKRINSVGYANTVVENDVNVLMEMGLLYQDVVTEIAKGTGKTYEQIQNILTNAGVKSIAYDDKIYIEAGLNPIKIDQSKSLVQIMNATIANTSSNLSNLVNTTAETVQTSFYNSMNMAYLEASTGVKSYSQAIKDAVNKIKSDGLYVRYPSGYKMKLEAAARMNIVTSTSQMCGKMQLARANELGWDLMELTAHPEARPEHQEWQGKIVSLSGQTGYLSLNDIGYGTITGFKGINCRHDWYPYYEGSAKTYSEEMLNEYNTDILKNSEKNDIIKLPNYENAVIAKEKFTEYALNPAVDLNKSIAFEKALGYNLSNADKLIENIYNNLDKFEATEKSDKGYGKRYEVLMTLVGENDKVANVKTAWIVDNKTGETRLTSAYITSKGWKKGDDDK